MKHLKLLALLLAALLCLTACGTSQAETDKTAGEPTKTEATTPDATEPQSPDAPEASDTASTSAADAQATPRPGSNIPDATTTEAPTPEGESYQTTGMYLGMADSNLMVIIEANPEDGQQEKSYQITPEIDLEAMGISEGNLIDLTYTVDENGIKIVKSVSIVVGE